MISNNNTSLVRRFSNYAVPTVLAAWVYCMHSVISGIFIGRYIGADALAALNLLVPLLYLPYAFSVMIGVGGSTLVSRLLGERRERDAAEAFTQALWLLGACGVAFALAIYLYADTFVHWTGARGELASLAVTFLHAYAPFVLFPTACYALELFLRIEGAAKFGLVCLIAGGIVDVALTWWMVSHMQWGMRGAALASGISQALACMPMLAYHFVKAQRVRPVARAFARLDHAWRMAYNGASEFLGEIAPSVTLFAFNHAVLRWLGDTGLVAFAVVEYMTMIASVTMVALVQSMQPIVSFERGARNGHAVTRAFSIGMTVTAGFALAAAFAILTLAAPLGSLFVPDSPAAQALLRDALPWCALAFLPAAINVAISGYLTAIEAPLASMIVALLRSWLLLLAMLWFLTEWLGPRGLWMTVAVTEMATLVASIVLYRTRGRRLALPVAATPNAT
ncbi:MATE family efflux transporter (plasmid) [Burkholderia sp. SFA1]|uniref:MATE family efflux transporter n=1 Tax=unclassified Caballeronia TaxID=2646786 RepID=UPI001EFF5964|nr:MULTISPECIES: MATE family efflux transporter [unclassified Caballeronia]MCE4546791.1 polysaccharide biosynthesis C-terminal domain-containing protein [Caballeronia sp. PC1]MCE4572736.1 polysaccharide biosynthesis C-terminal domain-containing protein [Caballeronia sp. CLC5]BBQ01889.1 MATE family efflux transporter [Burkholderia sp. SFA1]